MEEFQIKLTAADKEARRKLAIRNVLAGHSQVEVAKALSVHPVTVAGWMAKYRAEGEAGLAAKPVPGRPRFLTPLQEAEVFSWLTQKPTQFGFRTDLWTASRVAQLIREKLGVLFHPHYLREWLSKRGYSPQKPQRKARQQNPVEMNRWLQNDYPEVKKKSKRRKPTSS
jgi:transposase